MKRDSWSLLLVVLMLIALTAGFLQHRQTRQKLGLPGVKIVAQPIYDTDGNLLATNSVFLPEQVSNYKSDNRPVTQETLRWLPKDTTYGQRTYRAPDGFEAAFNVVLMGTDRTSIHKPQYCLSGAGWAVDPSELTTIAISEPYPYQLPVAKLTASHEGVTPTGEKVAHRCVYVYWFVADHELTAAPGQRMWWMARDLLQTGVLQRWAYVTCISYCAPGQEETTFNRMKPLISAAVPQFQLATGDPAPLARSF